MDLIGDLLSRHAIPGIRLSQQRQTCSETIEGLLGVSISRSKIKYKDGCLFLSVPPILKSALLLKERELKELLETKGIRITEIR